MVVGIKDVVLMNGLTQCGIYSFEFFPGSEPPLFGQFHSQTAKSFILGVFAIFLQTPDKKQVLLQAEYRGVKFCLRPGCRSPQDAESFHLYLIPADTDISRYRDYLSGPGFYITPPLLKPGSSCEHFRVGYRPENNPRKKLRAKYFRSFDGALAFCVSHFDEVIL